MSWILDKEYINFAWEFQHYGKLLLWDGTILEYDFSDLKTDYRATLDEKIESGKEIGQITDETLLEEIDSLVDEIKSKPKVPLVRTQREARDAGGTKYSLFVPDAFGTEDLKFNLFEGGNQEKASHNRDYQRLFEIFRIALGDKGYPL